MAHLMQLGFLIFFENPHIDRTYGHSDPDLDAERVLYDPKYVQQPSIHPHSIMSSLSHFDRQGWPVSGKERPHLAVAGGFVPFK